MVFRPGFTGISIALLYVAANSCNKPVSQSDGGSRPVVSPPTTTTPVTVDSLTFASLSTTTIYTSDAGSNNCVGFTISALTASKAPAPSATITVTLAGVTDASSYGQLSTPLTTGDDGKASGTFCASNKTGQITLRADSAKANANSGVITVTTKPFYSFTYRNSDFDANSPKPAEAINLNLLDSGPNDCGNLYFQLSKLKEPVKGVTLKFRSDFGYPAGAKLRPRTNIETPYETDTATQKNFLYHTATSDTDGLFTIPVCAGQLPGSFIVYTNYTDEYGKNNYARSPTITINSGVANLTTLGLNFDSTNARTLKALFNNETPTPLNFIAKISSVFGGALSVLNPVYIHTESGSPSWENGGKPDATGSLRFSVLASHNGTARPTPVRLFQSSAAQTTCDPEAIAKEINIPVTAGAFDLGKTYKIVSLGSTDFTQIGAPLSPPPAIGDTFTATGPGSGTGTARLVSISYGELAKNWRSTLLYMMRGQEPFNDANRNGKYDTGGDGFWDKNQDGAYTQGIDAVTYFGAIEADAQCRCLDASGSPATTAPSQGIQATPCVESSSLLSCFRRNSEWFLDLPTPFVDANENGIYEKNVAGQDMDRLIGDDYLEPNGRRDVDTLIWKSVVLPIYTGTSPYALVRSAIKAGNTLTPSYAPDAVEKGPVTAYFQDLSNRNLNSYGSSYITILDHAQVDLDDTNMFGTAASGYRGYRWVLAHGVCGTPVPGGTKIQTTDELISEPFGSRTVTFHYHMQPGDLILDPSRRLLSDGTGGSSATINFNIPDHPSSSVGYPIQYSIDVAPCTRAVPNGFGVWCSAATHIIHTTVDSDTVSARLDLPEYDTSTCKSGYSKNYSTGTCDSNT